ncbi:MAG TPA: arylsulfatase [Micromonosporaceae bacterium]|nr:arylsulfatase [Micromonosporaceae bacterium]
MSDPSPEQRSILPIPNVPPTVLTTYDARDPDTDFPPIRPLRPPLGAPNVLLILLDDVGFGASSAFGGPVNMPTAERLAGGGLRFNRFHTTALCSPTRAALLSGRNHHTVGMGTITELATSAPGYTGIRPNTCAPLAEILRLNGYATAHIGKCHEVPVWETSPAGPFDRWPTGNGFEYFYGFIGGETNQYYPDLVENTTPVEPDRSPEEGYHLMPDLADHMIRWIRQQKALTPDRPFFAYFAPGATHAPHHVPPEWADRYKGRFDKGWDVLREETFGRQKQMGSVPTDCDLTARHDEIPAWDDMDDELKPVLLRQMEIYAGFLEYADHHVGRVIDSLEALGIMDDTLVYYIIGDNGASAEGSLQGTLNEIAIAEDPTIETPAYLRTNIDKLGGPEAYNHYAVGWAHAMCTPYQWTKQVASHWGGTRNATIVHWPSRIKSGGGYRSQFCHVTDFAPTVLDVVGLPHPSTVHGVTQEPMHGVSMAYAFDDAYGAERHDTQYFEMMCNRGIYHKGWSAITKHRTPWEVHGEGVPFDEDVWELYDGSKDWTQAHDLSGQMPDKLAELQRLFLIEAAKHNVLPLDDRMVERVNPDMAGRPVLIHGDSQMLFDGMIGLQENCMLNLKNKSHSITAEITVPSTGAHGVIVNEGGVTGGWVLYLTENGRLAYHYNFLGIKRTTLTSDAAVPVGTHQVRMEFAYDGGGIGKGGTATLYVDGKAAGSTRIDRTHAFNYSLCETGGVGKDAGSPVSNEYPADGYAFTGDINWVRLDIGRDSQDHLLDPEQLFQFAVSRQ